VAAICLPIVLIYQGWTYHVFRARLGGGESAPRPAETVDSGVAGVPLG
jgi:hypothetical protein